MSITRIYISRPAIELSKADGLPRPALVVSRGGESVSGYAAAILGPSRIAHDPEAVPSTWIETEAAVRLETEPQPTDRTKEWLAAL